MNFQDSDAMNIIGIIILAFAVIGFFKGLIRTVLAMICLGIAGYAALWGNEHASDLTGSWIASSGIWIPKIIAVVTGLAVFLICRFVLNFLINPFNRSKTGQRIGFGLPAAFLSLCSGLSILWLAFAGIRYGGSLAELRYTRRQILGNSPGSADIYAIPIMLQAKHMLDASPAGKWHRRTDPFHKPGKLTLCRILVMYHHARTRELLLRNPAMNSLVNHPAFLRLAYQETIKNLASSGKPRGLFTGETVGKALAQSELMAILEKINSAEFLPIPAPPTL